MNIAGLDIATKTGLAVMKDGVITTQTFLCSPKKKRFLDPKEDGGKIDPNHEGLLARRFDDYLMSFFRDQQIGYCAIEAPINSSTSRIKTEIDPSAMFAGQSVTRREVGGTSMAAVFRLYGLQFIAMSVCSRLNIPVVSVGQGTWRKEFTGSGLAKDAKARAERECRKLGIEISSVDAAEAAGIVWWLDRTLNPYAQRQGNDLFSTEKKVAEPEELMARVGR